MMLTVTASALPWWLVLPFGAWLTAWHMSLQHEVIHGHPTPWSWLNDLIGSAPLSLWLPYERYKRSHLGHHAGLLTDPLDDPESHYVTAECYAAAGPVRRALLHLNTTLLGRLVIGPALGIAGFLLREARALLRGDRAAARDWLLHLPGLALVLGWLLLVCHLSLARFALLFVYPGFALALLRSFAEHRASDAQDHRTAIVENTPLLGLLFLHNNLHVVHHARPGLAWYRIPADYRAGRADYLRRNDGLVYAGYREVARRFLVRPHDRPWQ
ncbi:fatty acid desaturase [Acetobacteraceae bacterium KSS8]|uniref:Fatty acid desaturase n=1 Tax=Endosaccharibacter trunci TaxID=2812733 RepID=A0ABT1W4C9_9PROT|nr:fatty acid desaturase [Acetobacteraceae bacterium KSS8]